LLPSLSNHVYFSLPTNLFRRINMTEYQILNLMHVGFIQNAMYFVGMVIMTWLAFRMCNNVRSNPNTNMAGKVFTSVFCLFVALFMTQTNAIGGSILASSVASLVDVGAASADRMSVCIICSCISISFSLDKRIRI
jgi:hypothetical protein